MEPQKQGDPGGNKQYGGRTKEAFRDTKVLYKPWIKTKDESDYFKYKEARNKAKEKYAKNNHGINMGH